MPASDEFSAEQLALALEVYLAEHPSAVVLEDGKSLFYFRDGRAKYSLDLQHGRCVLQIWSEERNVVRRIKGMRVRKQSLLLETLRLGQARPGMMEFTDAEERRAPSERKVERSRFLRSLTRAAARQFGDWKVGALTAAPDLEHSFGPAYVRGQMQRANSSMALVAVGSQETADTVDGALTLGILWLSLLRQRGGNRRLVEGLRLIVPNGMEAVTAARMSWLDFGQAKWELWAFDEAQDELKRIEPEMGGNLATRLLRAPEEGRVRQRFEKEIDRLTALAPGCEVRVVRADEVTFSIHGLVIARAKFDADAATFAHSNRITFGSGANETGLNGETEGLFRSLLARLTTSRIPGGDQADPLYRMQAEAWLESKLRQNIAQIYSELEPHPVYSQMSAFAGKADRGMLDIFCRTRRGQLVVIEIKAHEDMQLAMQGLDYWMRVRQLHLSLPESEFSAMGYFPTTTLDRADPLLMLVAPALRIHPAVEIVLRHLSPKVAWQLVALDERWRTKLKVVWRKRNSDLPPQAFSDGH